MTDLTPLDSYTISISENRMGCDVISQEKSEFGHFFLEKMYNFFAKEAKRSDDEYSIAKKKLSDEKRMMMRE